MAATRKKQDVVPDGEETIYIETGAELNDALQKMFAEAGTSEVEIDAAAHVYLVEADGSEPKIWKGSPGEYDLDKLAREHGSGNYRLKVYAKDETGQFRLKLNKVFPYRLSAEADARLRAIRKGDVVPSSAGVTGAVPLSAQDITRMVQEAVKAAQPVPVVDPLAMMDRVAGIFGKMNGGGQQGSGMGLQQVFDMSRSLVTMVKDMAGGGDGGNHGDKPGDRALTRGIDLVATMMERHMAGNNAAAPAQAARTDNQPKPGEEMQLTQEQMDELEDLRMALRFAVRAARNNTDPAEFADSNYDHVPLVAISDMMTNPKWFDVIVGNAPDASQFQPWFLKVREALISIAVQEKHLTPDGQIVQTPEGGDPDKGTGAASGGKPAAS